MEIGDQVELTAPTLLAIASETPMVFKKIYTTRATDGVVTEFGIGFVRVDFGDEVNAAHERGRNAPPRGIPIGGTAIRPLNAILRVLPSDAVVPKEPVAEAGQAIPLAPPDAIDDAGGMPGLSMGDPSVMEPMPAAMATDGFGRFQFTRPVTPAIDRKMTEAAVDRIPWRIHVAQGTISQIIGLKQYSIVQEVNREHERHDDDPTLPGDEWKNHREDVNPVRVELSEVEQRLYEAATDVLIAWMRSPIIDE